jgi:hypothetical protein
MRVPIPIAVLICVLGVGISWWLGTRNKDFLTPPPGLILPVRPDAPPSSASPPRGTTRQASIPTPSPSGEIVALDTFADQAAMGPGHLIQLAQNLQDAKFHHLALLAWERVLDATPGSPTEVAQARAAILSLRGEDTRRLVEFPATPLNITLQAGTARKHVEAIQPHLEQTAREIEAASSGILRVQALITGGADPTVEIGTPVAIWITGHDAGSRSSEVLSFTLQPGLDVKERIELSTLEILRNLIGRSLTTPPQLPTPAPFTEELSLSITRRAWLALGTLLNLPIEENP